MKRRIAATILMVLIFTIVGFTCSSADGIEKYKVTADYLRVRSKPGGEVFAKLKNGTIVDVERIIDGWAKVLYDFGHGYGESYGYVWSEYLERCQTSTSNIKKENSEFNVSNGNYIIKQNAAKWLNVRNQPSYSAKRISKLIPGNRVYVKEIKSGWATIMGSSNQIGYIRAEYISSLNDIEGTSWIVEVSEGSNLNLRIGPSTEDYVMAKIKRGTILYAIEKENDKWIKVHYNGIVGYVNIDYIRQID